MSDLKFICDRMLKKLAIWLRIAGYDTLYIADLEFDGDEDTYMVYNHKDRILQRPMHNTGCIERMKPLAHMLQDQHVRFVIDGGDRRAEAIGFRSKATVATARGGVGYGFSPISVVDFHGSILYSLGPVIRGGRVRRMPSGEGESNPSVSRSQMNRYMAWTRKVRQPY